MSQTPGRGSPRRLAIGLLGLTIFLGLGACGGERSSELRDDPMAGYEAAGIQLKHESSQKDGKSLVTGKLISADITRVYDIADVSMSDQILEGAITAAEQAGWMVDRELASLSSTRFRKEFEWGYGSLRLSISKTMNGKPVLLLGLHE